jgi:hypothetical protein
MGMMENCLVSTRSGFDTAHLSPSPAAHTCLSDLEVQTKPPLASTAAFTSALPPEWGSLIWSSQKFPNCFPISEKLHEHLDSL